MLVFTSCSVVAERYHFADVEAYPLAYSKTLANGETEVQGLAIELFLLVMHRLGHTVKLELLPGKRVLLLAKRGMIDGIPFLYKTKQREEYLDYCETVLFHEKIHFYVTKDSDFQFDGNLKTLIQTPLAIILGDTYGEAFNTVRHQLTLIETQDVGAGFRMLINRRVEAVLSTPLRSHNELHRYQKQVRKYPRVVDELALYVAMSKKRNLMPLKKAFDDMFQQLKLSGEVQRVTQSWFERFRIE